MARDRPRPGRWEFRIDQTGQFVDDILIDQGDADPFLSEQLKPDLLVAACEASGQKIMLRMQPGYDHSYFFMASFIADHVAFHARRLKG